MTQPSREPNVLAGLTDRMRTAMVIARWQPERAARLERTLLMDVAMNGIHALRVRKNARKR